jgi:hypothetical protein
MTAKEAYMLIKQDTPKLKVVSCIEYNTLFVFQVVPEGYKPNGEILFDCLRSVNKTTGVVRDFKPFHISVEEYRKGKTINNFI